MRATVVGLVTPHLLRIVDLANQAEKGVNVDWHVRDAVAKTMGELSDQHNATALVASYIEGLEAAEGRAAKSHVEYLRVVRAALAAARNLRRD
jgi:hypothetical protein